MNFQIKGVFLWPRNASFRPRRIRFQLGKVNVISGGSRTGKSAIIPIIDYCLGGNSCSIPVNTIRDACEWFGVVISTPSGDKLLARREPGAQRITDDMFLLEGAEISSIPARITKNTSADQVRRLLDEIVGLSNLDFGAGEQSGGFEGRPSFRDLAAFTFQPQNIIANPDVFFFKTNTYEHREKLRKIFPYILGAITPQLLARQHELRRIQTELRRKEKDMREAEAVSARWMGELRSKISEAQELGLLPALPESDLIRDRMLQLLNDIVQRTDLTLAVSSTTISVAIRELSNLEAEESATSSALTTLRRRLAEMNRVQTSVSNYHDALRIQRERLQISDWLVEHRTGDENCPICGNDLGAADDKLQELSNALADLEQSAGLNAELPAAFEREVQRVQEEISVSSEQLKAIQIRKSSLSSRSQEAKQRQFDARRAERFVGNLENALELHKRLGEDTELRNEIDSLRSREQELVSELRAQNIDSRRRRALSIVNSNAERLLPYLDVERPNDPVSLETNDLTVKVTGLHRDDYLSEIGSGSNWLAYHVAVLLGLHQYFMTLEHNPVPSFLIIDQPSQVYFPKKSVVRADEVLTEFQLRDEDIVAVRKVFEVLGSVIGAANGQLQTIVLDHAANDVWGGIDNVVEVEEWRGGLKLVPDEWLQPE